MKLPKSITREEFPKLIKATPKRDKEALLAFLLAYGSGLRLSEITALQPLNVRQNDILILQGKGGKDRVVPKPKGWKPWMLAALPIKKSGRSLERNFKTAIKKAGLNPAYTFHSLRHGFATHALQAGIPINQVQLLLGHADIGTTGIYLKARPEEALANYENLF